jgi:hypothetical protein
VSELVKAQPERRAYDKVAVNVAACDNLLDIPIDLGNVMPMADVVDHLRRLS